MKLVRNQIYIESLSQIMVRQLDLSSKEWSDKKFTVGEIRMAISSLKEDLTNSQTQAVKVMTFNRISPAGIDAKKVKISYEEVLLVHKLSKHKVLGDCWMCIQGIVYDITDYVAKHPGGKIIMEGAGKDATNLFSRLA
jgi:cytochrome b involved in lipid metabolism